MRDCLYWLTVCVHARACPCDAARNLLQTQAEWWMVQTSHPPPSCMQARDAAAPLALLPQTFPNLQELMLCNFELVGSSGFRSLQHCTRLTSLSLTGFKCTETTAFGATASCAAAYQSVSCLTRLTSLKVHGLIATGAPWGRFWEGVGSLTSLHSLDIDDSNMSGARVCSVLAPLTQLQTLKLGRVAEPGPGGLTQQLSLPALRALEVRGSVPLTLWPQLLRTQGCLQSVQWSHARLEPFRSFPCSDSSALQHLQAAMQVLGGAPLKVEGGLVICLSGVTVAPPQRRKAGGAWQQQVAEAVAPLGRHIQTLYLSCADMQSVQPLLGACTQLQTLVLTCCTVESAFFAPRSFWGSMPALCSLTIRELPSTTTPDTPDAVKRACKAAPHPFVVTIKDAKRQGAWIRARRELAEAGAGVRGSLEVELSEQPQAPPYDFRFGNGSVAHSYRL